MTLAKRIYVVFFWALVGTMLWFAWRRDYYVPYAAWVTEHVGKADLGVFVLSGLVIVAVFVGLQDLLWNGYLYVLDLMMGTAKYDVVKRDKMRRAKVLERKMQWEKAGRVYEEVEEFRTASDCYQKAKLWDMAGRVLEFIEDHAQSARMYEKAGMFEQAVQMYTKAKDEPGRRALHMRAGERAMSDGRLRPAAEHFIQAHQFLRGAELLEQLEHYSEAADIYLKEGLNDRAAGLYHKQLEVYQKMIDEGNPPVGGLQKLSEVQVRLGEALEAAGHYEESGIIAEKLGEWSRAGTLYAKAGLHERAADAFLKAGNAADAKTSLAASGNSNRMREFAAIQAMEEGDYSTAAREFLKLNQIEKALDACRRGKDYAGMGQIYEKLGRYVTAGEQYSMGRKFDKAAEMYELGQDYAQAAELYEQIGNHNKAIECHEKRRDHYAAGKLYQKQKAVKKAIACFQRVPRGDQHYRLACGELGTLFTLENQFDQALSYFNLAFEEGHPKEDVLEGYYQMARKLEEREKISEAASHYRRIIGFDYSFRDASDRYNAIKEKYPQIFEAAPMSVSGQGGYGMQSGGYQQQPMAPQFAAPGSSQYGFEAHGTNPGFGGGGGPPSAPPIPGRSSGPLPRVAADSEPALAQAAYAATQRMARGAGPPSHPGSSPFADPDARYELLEEIGRGGMGIVYKARDTALDRTVALKMLSSALFSGDDRSYEHFLREARTIARLTHPNIVTIYDIGTRGDRYYLSMEYISGGNLRNYVLEHGPPPIGRTLRIVSEICAALKIAHEAGIVHRDIKPGNVLLTEREQIKIVDFGLAKLVDEATGTGGASGPSSVSGAFMMGTPQYMSPEQIRGEVPDQRADIYALGLTLYYLLVGKQVFDDFNCKSAMEVVNHQLRTPLPSPLTARPELPREVEIVYFGCIEKERDKRFASVQAVLDQLAAIPV